ncbi:hypothetical protein ABPG75_002004 [Micractinium tetrahymenae]
MAEHEKPGATSCSPAVWFVPPAGAEGCHASAAATVLSWRLATPSPVCPPPLSVAKARSADSGGLPSTAPLPTISLASSSSGAQPSATVSWVPLPPACAFRAGQRSFRLAPGRHRFPGAASRAAGTPHHLQEGVPPAGTSMVAAVAAVAAASALPPPTHAALVAAAAAAAEAPLPEEGAPPAPVQEPPQAAPAAPSAPPKHAASTGSSPAPPPAKRRRDCSSHSARPPRSAPAPPCPDPEGTLLHPIEAASPASRPAAQPHPPAAATPAVGIAADSPALITPLGSCSPDPQLALPALMPPAWGAGVWQPPCLASPDLGSSGTGMAGTGWSALAAAEAQEISMGLVLNGRPGCRRQ